jgi:signal transduction histidine kinase
MRRRFALTAAIPAFVALLAMALLADRLARRALEDELGERLVAVARAAASSLPADRVAGLAPGDEGTRTLAHLRARLESLAAATSTRIFVIRPDRTALVDSAGQHRIGESPPALERDRLEIAEASRGRSLPSQVLFQGSDGRLYKTGYAPLAGEDGAVVAVVGADGTAASFATLRGFRRLLVALGVGGALVAAALAALAGLSLTRPLMRLTEAAERIGRGDLATPLWRRVRKDQIGLLRDTFEEMRRSLRARDEERETLLAGIAHEIRNPLGGMQLFTGLLAEELSGRPEAAHVDRIRTELSTLSRVVDEFLDYARARPLQAEPCEVEGLVAEVAVLVGPIATERGVRVDASGRGRCAGDREKLRRALLNLARNAVEASPAGAAVEIVGRAEGGGGAVLEVLDRGPGLTPEARDALFRPFFTTKERGTGLGLALAKKVAEAHGGTLELLPREGGGTVARLTLPRGER